ncbi:cytochrome c [Paracrocinitomix mangrovi]|uniref:c-type cytochrome n=1 Tax=Paracrocinitomix mangrovi TaxID=2862509 RepID=UPI001C8E74D4|nr:cytochrome c [Paracrocinitomix mangrovi]UKN02046.1 cytochrome c [Paracrocinitomix mangrovi]
MKVLIYLSPLFLLFACGNSSEYDEFSDDPAVSVYPKGKEIYDRSCIACHMEDGKGLEGTFPPLAASDYLLANPKRALKQVLEGSSEVMVVNGVEYDNVMPPQSVSEEEAVEVVNYILNAWGNEGGEVSSSDLP